MSRRAGLLGATAVVLVAGAVALRTDLLDDSDTLEDHGALSGPAQASPSPSTPSASPSPPPSPTPGPALLLPDLRSLGASDLSIERVGDRRRLRFAASLGNLGPGPLLVRPQRRTGDCAPGRLRGVQLVHEDRDDDGTFERRRDRIGMRRPAGCMLDHRGHDHWHFDAMARYALRRPGAAGPLVARDKVSFCLRDNRRVTGMPVVVRREHFGECERRGPQGISPGWVDLYESDLDGQWLRLPGSVRDTVVCLDLEADPDDLLVETDERNNATSLAVRVTGPRVRRADQQVCDPSAAGVTAP